MKKIALLVAPVLIFLNACQTPQPRNATFIETEYVPYDRVGTGRIEGQTFMATRGGAVIRGAGREVWLNPVTSYSMEWYERSVVGYQPLEPSDARAKRFSKTTIADADGNFSFDGLPAGEYYLACQIVWEAGSTTTGGIAHQRVTVREGQTTKAIVTR